jgi:[ribosomal protein S5]-alanine N-acetyltransferase
LILPKVICQKSSVKSTFAEDFTIQQKMLPTERLLLRPFQLTDAPFIRELLNTPGWLQYIGDRGVNTVEDAHWYLLDRIIPSYQKFGFGFYCCELLASGTPIGMCGVVQRPYLDDPDIGFAFLPAFTGQGYALESAQAMLAHATEVWKLPKILAFTTLDNERSIQLLKKIGLHIVGPFSTPDDDEELLLMSTQTL